MRTDPSSESLDSTFHALADPTRRAILQCVARSETRITELAAPFRISLNSVSKHIRVLERARLVERRKVGREHLIRFRPEPLQGIQEWIAKQEAFWRAGLEALDTFLNQADEKGITIMTSKVEARVSHRFKAAAERVYDAWLDPEQVRVWMAASLRTWGLAGDIRRLEIDPRVGGKFFFSDMRDGTVARHWGTYLTLDRPRTIVFTWIIDESAEADPSRVTLTIQPESEGCTVTIVHEMDAKWVDYVARTEDGWGRMLAAVDRLLD